MPECLIWIWTKGVQTFTHKWVVDLISSEKGKRAAFLWKSWPIAKFIIFFIKCLSNIAQYRLPLQRLSRHINKCSPQTKRSLCAGITCQTWNASVFLLKLRSSQGDINDSRQMMDCLETESRLGFSYCLRFIGLLLKRWSAWTQTLYLISVRTKHKLRCGAQKNYTLAKGSPTNLSSGTDALSRLLVSRTGYFGYV